MSAYKPSDTAKKLISLLMNAQDLSINHSSRTLALDTIQSCIIFCKARNITNLNDVFDSLSYSIKNQNPQVLKESFEKAENFIIASDLKKK